MPDPKTLFLQHRAGDSTALPRLIEQLSPRLRALAHRMGVSHDRADDAIQETWLAALDAAGRFDAQHPFLPWLHGLMRHSVANQRRRERRHLAALTQLARERHLAIVQPSGGDASAARDEAAAALRSAIAELPSAQRRPLSLLLLDGLTPKEIARRLGLSRSTVRVLLFRGRRALRRHLPHYLSLLLLLRRIDPTSRTAHAMPIGGPLRRGAAALVATALALATWHGTVGTGAGAAPAVASAAAVELPGADPSPLASADRVAIEPSAQARLSVRVRASSGHPVAGVGVTIEPDDGTDPRLGRQTAVTGADGIAQFDAAAGPMRVFADRGATAERAAGQQAVELELPAGQQLCGTVTDGVRPVAGAAIWIGTTDDNGHGAVVARTGSDGSFALAAVPPQATIAAFAPGFRRSVRHRPGKGDLRLELARGGATLHVQVQDADGRPIRGARVYGGACADGVPARLPTDVETLGPPAVRLLTDDAGEARLQHLEPGTQPIAVRAPGHRPLVFHIAAFDGGELWRTCRLTRCDPILGRVVDDAAAPVAGAEVVLHSEDASADVVLRTAADGGFRAAAAPELVTTILATATGHAAARVELPAADPITLRLRRLPRWSGAVVDEWGQPLSDLEVRFASSERLPARADEVAWTDPQGSFAVSAPGEALCNIHLRMRDWPVALPLERRMVERHGSSLRLVVPRRQLPTARMLGRLTCADGRALANRQLGLAMTLPGLVHATAAVATTDAYGAFAIEPLPAGEFTILLADTGDGLVGALGPYAVADGATVDLGHRVLASGRLLGSFRFDDGSMPQSCHTIVRLPGSTFTLATRPGDVALEMLPGEYEINVVGEGLPWTNGTLQRVTAGGETRIHADIERAYTVRLRTTALPEDLDYESGLWLLASSGRRVCHFALDARAQEQPLLAVDLPPGDYVVAARRRAGPATAAPLRVDAAMEGRIVTIAFAR